VDRGTGKAARIGRPCAGKTGTSDGHRDVWFAGFTPELSCVVCGHHSLRQSSTFDLWILVLSCHLRN